MNDDDYENVQSVDHRDDEKDDYSVNSEVDGFIGYGSEFQPSLGFSLSSSALPREAELRENVCPSGAVNTTLHQRNGLNEPAGLRLPHCACLNTS